MNGIHLPDISKLSVQDDTDPPGPERARPPAVVIPDDFTSLPDDPSMDRLRTYAKSLPYSVEPYSKMQRMLDFFLMRIVQSVKAKDFDPGFLQWDSMLTYWCMLKYPIPKEKRIAMVKLYLEIATTPGMPMKVLSVAAEGVNYLTRSKRKLKIDDLRLPWKPIYKIIEKELFLCRRKFEINQLPPYMGFIVDSVRRFIHPAAIDEMLETFLPGLNGTSLNSILATEYYLLSFLPQSHPQSYLPMLFRLWESINSYNYDERMLHFLSQLAEIHVDPTVSDPKRIEELPDDARSEDEGRPNWPRDDLKHTGPWNGIYKDVGIFSEDEWNLIMWKCLASMEIPLADSGSLSTGPSVDNQSGFEIGRLRKPTWRIYSLARIIVYSMAPDGSPMPSSGSSTPYASGLGTPQPGRSVGDYLTASLGSKKQKTYLAGSKALDSLARLIVSTESFFHPSNSGSWTADLSAFIKYIVYEFNKRWFEEREPDCKIPMNRRLTSEMKRELVKCLRTVVLLAMFSRDSTTVQNIQSCIKSMTVMEAGLILQPIMERAIPALEALVETQRTTAMIKALGAAALAFVSRDTYYAGAKHLVSILQLLIPGIDLNDPTKTLCTTAFFVEVAQYIKFGDLNSVEEEQPTTTDTEGPHTLFQSETNGVVEIPQLYIDIPDGYDSGQEPKLTKKEEDALLKESTADFADWITSFIRRVILLLENLPDEGTEGSNVGGETEVQVVDAVTGACSQICVHLSDSLFDLVLNMVYDYASTNVRSNAVRAIHQLVECVANADAVKTLAKFLPFCVRNIKVELEHGASSLRTTSHSTPIPSDATLHWNLAILRGAMYNDGTAVLKYRSELLDTFRLLRDKSLSRRGYSWTGKLLSSCLLTLTHTYPLENRFVNPDEWDSEEFKKNHHRYWGKLYKPEDVKMSWHVPCDAEIDFALELFRELVEPTLAKLEKLLEEPVGASRNGIWRNDFCRYLTFVRNAFAGTPTLIRFDFTEEEFLKSCETSDILNEIPEMIAHVEPLAVNFVLENKDDPRYQYMMKLRSRYGAFLVDASEALQQHGDEITVDAVHVLIRAIRTYMLEYGDSRDGYFSQSEQYTSDLGLTRQYANQKHWPRAVLVRRARRYHAARLRWNSIERPRGVTEDRLIDELLGWATWHYSSVRQSSQSLLDSLCSTYDGVRRRSLPSLLNKLGEGNEDHSMKGALWTLNLQPFVKYAACEDQLAPELWKKIFECQHNEKPSIQECVSSLSENCLASLVEPSLIVYHVKTKSIDRELLRLEKLLPRSLQDDELVQKCKSKRLLRMKILEDSVVQITKSVLEVANSTRTHWRYAIMALRLLRGMIRRDGPIDSKMMVYFLNKTHASHPSLRYYAQRAVMKSARCIKIRSFSRNPEDIATEHNRNPLKRSVATDSLTFITKDTFLEDSKVPVDLSRAAAEPTFVDKAIVGWLVWPDHLNTYVAPSQNESVFLPWEECSHDVISAMRDEAMSSNYWKKLSNHFAEENHNEAVTQDNISCVKSIFQVLEDEPFEVLRPIVESLFNDVDQNKQRAAAELSAGILGAMKHWPQAKQQRIWDWFMPNLEKAMSSNLKPDTLSVWTSFFEYMFVNRDPRRLQPIVDYLTKRFQTSDFNSELSFDAIKILSFIRAFYEELGWRSETWMDGILDRYWTELSNEHDEVRAYVADILEYSGKMKWRPQPSSRRAEAFVRDCRKLSRDVDIMGIRGVYHKDRVEELVKNFAVWRTQRVPGTRAFQSTYDRVGVTVCKWLYQCVHDVQASSAYDYILPLIPELLRFSEVNDNDDLSVRASTLLVRMCGVVPPKPLINPILGAFFDAIKNSPSWRVRLKALPLLQIFYFRQVPLIEESKVLEILEVICRCLDDDNIEVREMAATTLTGILRLSPRHSVIKLKDRFVRLVNTTTLPVRQSPDYAQALRKLHAAILGICAIVDSFPYTVERWMPELLTDVLAEHTYDPIPVSSTVRKCASNFKKTHQDTWHEDSKRFSDDQLSALSTLLTGSSYYA